MNQVDNWMFFKSGFKDYILNKYFKNLFFSRGSIDI